ncbi:Protein jagged-1, partial [Ophiophagus hannah]
MISREDFFALGCQPVTNSDVLPHILWTSITCDALICTTGSLTDSGSPLFPALLPRPTFRPPCPSELCANGGSCRPTPSGPQCVCPPGWRGKACQDDVNECHRKPCLHARACKNLVGSYFCDCLPGWMGATCSIRMNLCPKRCQNGGTCQGTRVPSVKPNRGPAEMPPACTAGSASRRKTRPPSADALWALAAGGV